MLHYFYDNIDDVLKNLGTTKEGLSVESANERLKKYGPNVIKKSHRVPWPLRFLKQFTDLLAIILLSASLFSFILGSVRDALVIFSIVLANATIGFIQEFKAEKALEALKSYLPEMATVVRGDDTTKIAAKDLVPGDILVLSEGIRIPADARLISANELYTNDAALTGESSQQEKKALKTEESKKTVAALCGSIFMGTDIISGDGLGVVVATGMDTQFGKIAKIATSQKQTKSPLQLETDQLAKTIAKLTFWIVLSLMIIYSLLQGRFILKEAFEFAIGVASALVPEGLPATVSVALGIGVQRMAKRKAAMRRLSAVETLGEANVIVTDKTGTLTKNQMTVKEIFFAGKNYHVKGVGYNLAGEITTEGRFCDRNHLAKMKPLFISVTLANTAEVDTKNHQEVEYLGDSTELALLVAAEKAGLDTYALHKETAVTAEIPFTAERKFMARTVKGKGGETIYFKGAPNVILKKCQYIFDGTKVRELTEKDKKEIAYTNDKYSKEALRVMAAAYKKKDKGSPETNLIFLGLFGIIDPPREDAAETIRIARAAGIRTVMVTGDYGLTAAAIAKRIKLNENPGIITGEMLDEMSEHELINELKKEDILFSRVDPIHKLRIVQTFQKMGNIVAVTGDGVNDAPALKKSDIGVAMGLTGTDISKEAAEMVSLNDSFSSIVWAIKEGRIVYDNIRKAAKVILTNNTAEFTAVALGLFLGMPSIFAIQILLIDLGSEVFPALALAADREEDDVMKRAPRSHTDKLLSPQTLGFIVKNGLITGFLATLGFCLFGYANGWSFGTKFSSETLYLTATTVTYTTVSLCLIMTSFSIRSKSKGFLSVFIGNKWLLLANGFSVLFIAALMYVPALQSFSYMRGLSPTWWGICFGLAFLHLISLEISKKFQRQPTKLTHFLAAKIITAG